MSGQLPERLSRFTPDPGGLDRDALLFAAGRASARPARPWTLLTAALAVSQALTLVLLWPRPQPQLAAPAPAARPERAPSPPVESDEGGTQLGALRRDLLRSDGEELPPTRAFDSLLDTGPPWTAFGDPTRAIQN
jgi:hypothetical protein